MPSRRFAYLSFPSGLLFIALYSAFLPKMLPAVLPEENESPFAAESRLTSRYISMFCALTYSARSLRSERVPRRASRDAVIMLD